MPLGLQLPYAVDALDELVRQRMLDRLEREKRAEAARQFDVATRERGRQFDVTARQRGEDQAFNRQFREDQLASIQQQREADQAKMLVEESTGEDFLDPAGEALVKRTGFGSLVRQKPLAPPIPIAEVSGDLARPGRIVGAEIPPSRGVLRAGSRFTQAKEAGALRADVERDKIAGANQRAADVLEARNRQEGVTNQLRQQGLNIQAMMAGIAGDREARSQEKLDTEKAEKRAKALTSLDAMDASAQQSIGVLNQLQQPSQGIPGEYTLRPGAAAITGGSRNLSPGGLARMLPWGTEARNAEATRRQLIGKTIIDTISQMKQQSATGATGLGQIVVRELEIIEQAASKLGDPLLSDADYNAELGRVRQGLARVQQRIAAERARWQQGSAPAGAPSGDTYQRFLDAWRAERAR